jgi:recombination protein RecA
MAKGKDTKETKVSSVEDIMATINKKYGVTVMAKASKAKSLSGARGSSGIFDLDVALGGGWTKGRIHVLKGEFSSGKTLVSTKTIASYQRHCRHCNTPFTAIHQTVYDPNGEIAYQASYSFDDVVPTYQVTDEQHEAGLDSTEFNAQYVFEGCECGTNEPNNCTFIDAEGTFHPEWTEAQGVIVDLLNIVVPDFAEQAIDIVEALSRTGMIDLLVVDSVPALTPSAEVEKSAEDNLVGTHARLMNRFMRVLQSALNSLGMDVEQKPTIILINQLRQKVGVMFGNPETSPGGKGIDFTASTIVRMRMSQRVKINKTTGKVVDKDGFAVASSLGFQVTKNKTFKPFEEGEFRVDTDNFPEFGYIKGKVNNEEQIIKKAGEYDVVNKGGGGYYSYITTDGEEIKAQGAPAFTQALLDVNAFKEVAERTKKAVLRR